MKDTSQRVYFARCIDPDGNQMNAYKIGCSHGHNERLQQIASNVPFTLQLEAAVPGSEVLEAVCHLSLKEHRIAGEYFYANEQVCNVVRRAAEYGEAFYWIRDRGFHRTQDGALQAFMAYHNVSLEEVCELLGFPVSQYEKRISKPHFRSRKLVAAVAIIVSRRAQFAFWPDDALSHLLGEANPRLEVAA